MLIIGVALKDNVGSYRKNIIDFNQKLIEMDRILCQILCQILSISTRNQR